MQAVKIELLDEDPLLEDKSELLGRDSTFQPFRLLKNF